MSRAFKALDMTFRLFLALFTLFLILASSDWSYRELDRIPVWGESPLVRAYLFGDKSNLSRKTKEIHRDLNLQHLMTPSGLHLASLLFLIGLLSKSKLWRFFFLIVLAMATYPYDGIDSFKRMILFGLIRTNPFFKVSLLHSFIITFFLTFIGGQYSENPLSYSLSFIFLSILITGRSKLQVFSLLIFIQAILSDWFGRDFFPFGAIYGLILSLVSPFLFPLLLLESLFSWLPISKVWLFFLEYLHGLKGIGLSLPFFILLPPIFFTYRNKLSFIALILSVLFYHRPITPTYKKTVFLSPPPAGAKKMRKLKNGYRLEFENGLRCYSRLKVDQWSTHCYQ